jgi:hypothetical protein
VALVLIMLSLYLMVFHFYFGMYKLNIDNYLSILVTVIITSIWVLTYLFKLNIVFLDLPFTSQIGCLPSIITNIINWLRIIGKYNSFLVN